MLLTILYAISLGFIGSFHCIGMCGAIALTLPVQQFDGARKLAGILLYNAGRLTAYSSLGIACGWLGAQFSPGVMQQGLSVALGGGLLLIILLRYTTKTSRFLNSIRPYSNRVKNMSGAGIAELYKVTFYSNRIKNILGRLLKQQRFNTLYAIGFFNGLLPCGLVYFAIAGAVATGDVWQGALFMAAFGAGTMPAMVLFSWCSHLVSLRFRNGIRKCIPIVAGIMAILLIMRGLNLGIPYISPVLPAPATKTFLHCHKP